MSYVSIAHSKSVPAKCSTKKQQILQNKPRPKPRVSFPFPPIRLHSAPQTTRHRGKPYAHVRLSFGRPLPAFDGPSPALGRPSLPLGRPSPAFGGPSPALGRPSLPLGRPFPALGRPFPALGRPSPQIFPNKVRTRHLNKGFFVAKVFH